MIFKILCISILIVLLMLIDNHHKFKPYGTWKSPNNTNMHFVFNLRNVLLFNLFSNYYYEYYLSDYCSLSFVFIFCYFLLTSIQSTLNSINIQIVYFSARYMCFPKSSRSEKNIHLTCGTKTQGKIFYFKK